MDVSTHNTVKSQHSRSRVKPWLGVCVVQGDAPLMLMLVLMLGEQRPIAELVPQIGVRGAPLARERLKVDDVPRNPRL
jgi:hypothetical protein